MTGFFGVLVALGLIIGGQATGIDKVAKIHGQMYQRAMKMLLASGGRGSGVYLGDNKVMTARHVCDGAGSGIWVEDSGGNREFTKDIEASDSVIVDLCIVTLKKPPRLKKIKIGKRGLGYFNVWVAGFPGYKEYTLYKTERLGRELLPIDFGPYVGDKYMDLEVLNRYIPKGISGSGVYNENGELVGILVATSKELDKTYMVPVSYINGILKKQKRRNKD